MCASAHELRIGALKEYSAGIENRRILTALERVFVRMDATDFYLLAGEFQVQVAPTGGIRISLPLQEHPARWKRSHPTGKGQYASGPPKAKVHLVIGEDELGQWSAENLRGVGKRV